MGMMMVMIVMVWWLMVGFSPARRRQFGIRTGCCCGGGGSCSRSRSSTMADIGDVQLVQALDFDRIMLLDVAGPNGDAANGTRDWIALFASLANTANEFVGRRAVRSWRCWWRWWLLIHTECGGC